MDYYYLVASLPPLEFGYAPPIDKATFLFQCQGVLSESQLREVRTLLDGRLAECSSSFACGILSAETQLRNAVAKIRASKKGIDPRPFTRDHAQFHAWIENLVSDAFSRNNPREIESGLDHARWKIAEELTSREPFSFGQILAFAIKLRIALRWHNLDPEEGIERVEDFISNETKDHY